MSQLMIKDLDFCEGRLSELEDISGRLGFFKVGFAFASGSKSDLAGGAAAGYAVGIGVAIGGNNPTVITIGQVG